MTVSTSYPVQVASESDYVHDVSYNFYGNRLALCTSSQTISVWELSTDDDGKWTESARIDNAHAGPIWRLDWAHPEFGQVLASCSEDRTISVWSWSQTGGWKRRATLTDSPHAVTDVQFAPRGFGLKFAACTADGIVRVYEASDPLNLAAWEVEDFNAGEPEGCSALSWCSSSEVERLGVVGQSGKLKVFERRNRWTLAAEIEVSTSPLKDCAWAPNLCRDADWIAVCGDSEIVNVYALKDNSILVRVHAIDTKTSPIWRCAWSMTGDILSVAPENGTVQLWRLAGLAGKVAWERVTDENSPDFSM
jgi:nucleoporin SEH1